VTQVADDTENMAFSSAQLERFYRHLPTTGPYAITGNTIYVALDPNSGVGMSGVAVSDTAIVSFIVSSGCVVIVGLEYAPTPGHSDTKNLLFKHCETLRTQKEFSHCDIGLILEANNGKENDACAKYMLRRDSERIKVMQERKHNYGVYTVPGRPGQYVQCLQDRLAVDGLRYHDNLVCVSRKLSIGETQKQAATRARAELERQLSAFRVLLRISTSFGSRNTIQFTGKADKNGNRSVHLKDDMAMALMMGIFFYLRSAAEVPSVTWVRASNALVTDMNEERELQAPSLQVAKLQRVK
jgi:hypothetical protein